MSSEILRNLKSDFEFFVLSGQLKLFEAPENIASTQIGETVKLKKGINGYLHGFNLSRTSVVITETRRTINGIYILTYRDKPDTFYYLHPITKRRVVGSSDNLQFSFIESVEGQHRVKRFFAFYEPDTE